MTLGEKLTTFLEGPARLVVDATGWPQSVDQAGALFARLEQLLLREGPYPLTLVLLQDQYDQLPGSLDALLAPERVRLQRVKDEADAWTRTQALAGAQGLVLSARRFPDFERWIAADFDGTGMRLEPPDALERVRRGERLPALAPVEHDVKELVTPGREVSSWWHGTPCELHQLIRALRTEEGVAGLELDAEARQGLALELGVQATSTARERAAARLDTLQRLLPVSITPGSPADWEALQARARHRPLGPQALQVGDEVHLLNVPLGEVFAEGRPWVHVHSVSAGPTPLSRLLEAVAPWSELDFLCDPFLEGLLGRLEPEPRQREAWLHARAGLLLTGALVPRAVAPVRQWQPALEALLADEPPAARFRLHVQGMPIHYAGLERPSFVVTQERLEQLKPLRHPELHQVPPVGDVLLDREERPLVAEGKGIKQGSLVRVKRDDILRGWKETPHREEYRHQAPSILLPGGPESARDEVLWLDALEGSDFGADAWQGRLPAISEDPRLLPGVLLQWQLGFLDLEPGLWEDADRELAMAWLALRLALRAPQAIRLPDGAVLLRLGTGPYFAEVRLMPLAASVGPRRVQGALHLDVTYTGMGMAEDKRRVMRGHVSSLTEFVPTQGALGGQEQGARLPRRLYLLGEQHCADIRFRGSALFG